MITTPHTRPFSNPVIQKYAALGLDPTKIEALYLFDPAGNLYDASGNERHGAIVGASWSGKGRYGQALDFDGTDDYVEIADFDDSGAELSVFVWANGDIAGLAPVKIVLSHYDNGDANKRAWELGKNAGAQDMFILMANAAGATRKNYSTGNTSLSLGQFKHFGFTYNGAESLGGVDGVIRPYINGIEIAQGDITKSTDNNYTTIPNIASPFAIGGEWNVYPTLRRDFIGQIDGILIYKGVLTSGQVQNLCTKGL